MTTKTEPSVLDVLYDKRQKAVAEWTALVETRETERAAFEARSVSDDKPTELDVEAYRSAEAAFVALNDQHKAAIAAFDERIKDQLDIVERREAAAKGSVLPAGESVVRHEELTYTRRKGMGERGVSYYRDLAQCFAPGAVSFQSTDRTQSLERLTRHGQEMDKEMPIRSKSRERRALSQVAEAEARDGRSLAINPFEYRVEPNQGQGTGGYFIQPVAA